MKDVVCIYGPAGENDSWCRIARGMYKGLLACGVPSSFVDLRDIVLEQDEGLPKGYDAEIGIYCGPPKHMSILRRTGQHRERLVMIAANSSWLPPEPMDDAAHVCTGLLGPSHWACDVLRQHGSGLPVFLWQHGVDDAFCRGAPKTERSPGAEHLWRVLHLASTGLDRKGTLQLVEAWARCCRDGRIGPPQRAQLDLIVSAPHGYVQQALSELGAGKSCNVGLFRRANLSEEKMAALYGDYDLVCQPSRAEGFGLVPLEALACGVPVAATGCTGHSDYLTLGQRGVVLIAHGDETPSDDGPGAIAPSVSADDIADALEGAYRDRPSLEFGAWSDADELRAKWCWKAVTERFLRSFGLLEDAPIFNVDTLEPG